MSEAINQTEDKERNQQVAEEILRQLGGNKFAVMTGAKNFGFGKTASGNYCLSFKIMKNKIKCTHVEISLTPMDYYDVKFIKVSMKTGYKVLEEAKGMFCENLVEYFENVTGLYTRL